MKTVLVVEDEKAIRQGIAAIIRRGPVPVEQVVECRNGEEALEFLRREPADLVFTDLRMPKMDGAELVGKIAALPSPPLVVVISGYDEFDYAVRMMRMGVRDYLLKPVERRQLYDLLARMELELEQERADRKNIRAAALQIIRDLMLGGRPGESTEALLTEQFGSLLHTDSYAAVCLRSLDGLEELPPSILSLGEIEGQYFLLADTARLPALQQLLRERCAGFSGLHHGTASLREAYVEGMAARRHAFLRGRLVQCGEQSGAEAESVHFSGQAEQAAHLLGVGKATEARQILSDLFFRAQNGRVSPQAFSAAMAELLEQLAALYGAVDGTLRQLEAFRDPWRQESAYDYFEELCGWMEEFCARAPNLEENSGRKKIQAAVEYLHRNFATEIDMAVVSNQISMNYSQFSGLFKKYTGSNFHHYLRALRIEEGKRLLRNTDLGIRQISEKTGFKNEKHFMKAFKQMLAVSPTDYRKNIRLGEGRTD